MLKGHSHNLVNCSGSLGMLRFQAGAFGEAQTSLIKAKCMYLRLF